MKNNINGMAELSCLFDEWENTIDKKYPCIPYEMSSIFSSAFDLV